MNENYSREPIRFEVFDSELNVDGFTKGKNYPIFKEKILPLTGQHSPWSLTLFYLTIDDTGKERTVDCHHFNMPERFLSYNEEFKLCEEYNVDLRKLWNTAKSEGKLYWSGVPAVFDDLKKDIIKEAEEWLVLAGFDSIKNRFVVQNDDISDLEKQIEILSKKVKSLKNLKKVL